MEFIVSVLKRAYPVATATRSREERHSGVATRNRSFCIETTIERDKMGGSVSLPLSLIVLYGGFPQKFVSDLESAHLSDSTHFGGS